MFNIIRFWLHTKAEVYPHMAGQNTESRIQNTEYRIQNVVLWTPYGGYTIISNSDF